TSSIRTCCRGTTFSTAGAICLSSSTTAPTKASMRFIIGSRRNTRRRGSGADVGKGLSSMNGSTVAGKSEPCRVLLCDDSAAVRGFYRRALDALAQHAVDVVVLDIEMPVMDGLTALPRLLAAKPGVKVLVVSGLTPRGADISYKALVAGAAECVLKPGTADPSAASEFQRDLVAKVRALGAARRDPLRAATPKPDIRAPKLTPVHAAPVRAIAIIASTGGPAALLHLIPELKDGPTQPIFITQHMPARFTTTLAEHLSRVAGRPAAE